MNGPRTNQLVAPTSFITSISRRREKIESRIVFAIRSAAEVSRIATAIAKIASTQWAKWRIRFESRVSWITSFTPGVDRMQALVERIQVLGLLRRDDERVGERVERECSSGAHPRSSASACRPAPSG